MLLLHVEERYIDVGDLLRNINRLPDLNVIWLAKNVIWLVCSNDKYLGSNRNVFILAGSSGRCLV